jgi:glucose-6-phosphate 1-epimerase
MHTAKTTDFEIPGALRFEDTPGGLTRGLISTPSAEAEVYLHGAHLTHWTPRGQQPVLFVSAKSAFEPGKAIRGGVPVIFPWFGPRSGGKTGPMHGFARITAWNIEGSRLCDNGDLEISFALPPDDTSRSYGYAEFDVHFRLTIGAELDMELEIRNTAPVELVYEEALHTYFAVGDIHQVSVAGLAGTTYVDKADGFQRKTLGAEPIRIARETDQMHLNTEAACAIDDPAWSRRIVVEKSGSATTVVWNPWIEKTKTLADMAPDDWKGMICVETANAADDAIHLAPRASHTLRASIRVESING